MTAHEAIGLRAVTELAEAREVEPGALRLEALRAGTAALRLRMRSEGTIRAARTVELFASASSGRLVLAGSARSLSPWVGIIRRLVVVRFEGFDGVLRTLVWEPAVLGDRPEPVTQRMPGRRIGSAVAALERLGIDHVDYAGVNCLHGHDLRRLLGTTEPVEGEHVARRPLLPGIRLLCQRREVAAARSGHPLRTPWYVEGGTDHIDETSLVELDGDSELGVGVALLATPGRSAGHQSLVLNTPEGLWVCSRNGICADAWQPHLSKIPGVRTGAEASGREVLPELEPVEDTLGVHDSMVLEKSLADANRSDPRWRNLLPVAELASWRRQWPIVPTFTANGPELGRID
jgi:hypothetical protein